MEIIFLYLGYLVYFVLGGLALWGAYCVVMVWRRVAQTRFRSEDHQDDFLEELSESIAGGNMQAAIEMCEGDRRAMPQLALFALNNRDMGYNQVRSRVSERFEQDVLADIEQRLSWVSTVIKSAPMVGLLGTVMGMMGAFSNIASAQGGADTAKMAQDIMFALITTASGLAIAIPLVLATASINIRIRKMESLIGVGLNHLFELIGSTLGRGR